MRPSDAEGLLWHADSFILGCLVLLSEGKCAAVCKCRYSSTRQLKMPIVHAEEPLPGVALQGEVCSRLQLSTFPVHTSAQDAQCRRTAWCLWGYVASSATNALRSPCVPDCKKTTLLGILPIAVLPSASCASLFAFSCLLVHGGCDDAPHSFGSCAGFVQAHRLYEGEVADIFCMQREMFGVCVVSFPVSARCLQRWARSMTTLSFGVSSHRVRCRARSLSAPLRPTLQRCTSRSLPTLRLRRARMCWTQRVSASTVIYSYRNERQRYFSGRLRAQYRACLSSQWHVARCARVPPP